MPSVCSVLCVLQCLLCALRCLVCSVRCAIDGKIPMKNGGFHGKVMGTIHENGENGRISPFNMVIFWEY